MIQVPIAGWSNYEITSKGQVWSKKHRRFLKPSLSNAGYMFVTLSQKGKRVNGYIHRLVAEAFLKNDEAKRTINHISGDKTDNAVTNLEWATYGENNRHAFAMNLNRNVGEGHHSAKLTAVQVINIRAMQGIAPAKSLAESLGVSTVTIRYIWQRKTWKTVN